MLRALTAVSVLALAAAAQPALAQDAGPYFEGFYLSGAASLDAPGKDSDKLTFDTNRDGAFDNAVVTVNGGNAFSPGFCDGAAVGGTRAAGCTADDDDIGYAVRAGYDMRWGPLVGGIVIEGSTSDAVDYTSGFSTTPASYTTAREIDYSIAARTRAGYSPGDGRGLFYITGGLAYARIKHGFTTTNVANSFTMVDDDEMRLGVQFGGGAELMVTPNIGIGLEYLYSRYDDDQSYVAVGQGSALPSNPFLLASGGTNLRTANSDFNLQSFRATASFHF